MSGIEKIRWVLILAGFFIFYPVKAAIDLERERQIANDLVSKKQVGEPVWLGNDSKAFLGLLSKTPFGTQDTVIILIHGMGAHPDWPDVIGPLRQSLPENKVSVISIQMPVLALDAPVSEYGMTFVESARRIKITVEYLYELGFTRIILAGYSFGAVTAAYYLINEKQHGVSALIIISMLAMKFLNPSVEPELLLEKIDIPVLDIYAENDLYEVLYAVPDRRLAVHKSVNHQFKQVEIKDSGHTYVRYERELLNAILNWLMQPANNNELLINSQENQQSE